MKTLLVASGGYDSHVIANLCTSLGYDCHCLFFDYGQKAYKKEKESLLKLVDNYFPVEFRTSEFYKELKVELKWTLNYEQSNYFPWRNLVFMAYALSYAEAKKFNMIVTGINASEMRYPDTTLEYLTNFEKMCNSVNIKLWTPLQELYKGDVFELGTKLGVDLKDTWSCDYSDDVPCGKCGSCLDIKRGIEQGFLPRQEIKFLA